MNHKHTNQNRSGVKQSIRTRGRHIGIADAALMILMTVLFFGFASNAQAEFAYRKPITIDHTKVIGSCSGDLYGFAVLVVISGDVDLKTVANGGHVQHASGYDIIFRAADGITRLNHEVMSYNGSTGSLMAWVRVPQLSASADTTIYLVYGDSSINASQQNVGGVWDANYEAVLHLQEAGSGGDDEYTDSSGNAHHGTGGGLEGASESFRAPDHTTGIFGYAQDFDGEYDIIRLDAVDDTSWTAVSVQAWINPDDTGDDRLFGKCWGTGSDDQTWLLRQTGGKIGVRLRTDAGYNGGYDHSGLSSGNWHLVSVTWDASDNQLRVFLNGIQKGSTTLNGSQLFSNTSGQAGYPDANYTAEPSIGNTPQNNRDYNGQMQEVRLSKIARTACWFQTEYNNQSSPASFYSIGAEEHASNSYTITAISGSDGSISPSGAVTVDAGTSRTFTMTPDSGYEVIQVLVDGGSVGTPTSYTFSNITSSHTISVAFGLIGNYTIFANSGSYGSISPAGAVSVAPGDSQSFTITPEPGYDVDHVLIDGTSVGAVTAFDFTNVTADHTIDAQFVSTGPPPDLDTCLDISDIPLDVRRKAAPGNIMIAFDDSGSMAYEILVPGAVDGRYQDQYDNLFDNPCGSSYGPNGCHEYDRSADLARGAGRLHWKTQWSEYNKVYYNPAIDYEPWVTMSGSHAAADPDNPRSHPLLATPTFNLSASFDTVAASIGSFEIIADNEDPAVFSMTGPWTYYTHPEAYKDTYYAAVDVGPTFTATWSPDLPVGGQYQLYARWHANEWRSVQVEYTYAYDGGTTSKHLSQKVKGGEWNILDELNFAAGPANVSLSFTVADSNVDRVCADAIKFVPTGTVSLDIKRAHYYVKSEQTGKPYLVIIDGGTIDYYQLNDNDADDVVDAGELVAVQPPEDIVTGRTYAEERQNFANWYTYFRKRGYTAQYAVGKLISSMQGVRIGIYSINGNIQQTVLPVKVDGVDNGDTLLNTLYNLNVSGGTPLRRALETAGRYFDKTDNLKMDNTSGDDSPWNAEIDGGDCQQAFTILLTDGYYNGSDPVNTNINNQDGDNGDPYEDTYSKTLADVAMYFYERDLNTGLSDNVPVNDYDDATHQHMVTYSIGFGVVGSLDPGDYDDDLKHKSTDQFIDWTDPDIGGSSSVSKIDDLWHSAVNGRGQFLNAGNPAELILSLRQVMRDIELRMNSSSQVAVNGDKLYQKLTPDLLMFQNSYSSDGWTGEVKAYQVDHVTGEVDTSSWEWSAAAELQKKNWYGRLIATFNGSTGIPFQFDSLTDLQKDQLDAGWQGDATNAANLVKYLRGDDSLEEQSGGSFRTRFFTLGDIVHSSPVFRNGMLYVGSNDGMLHAFDADSGEELFAYVPNLVFENLKDLADPNYTHQYYVDMTPTIEDVNISGISTLLVNGLGKGGRGYFALDVSDLTPTYVDFPISETDLANRVLWEYPDLSTGNSEIGDLGYSFSKPTVVQTHDSDDGPWVVLFGNGYNSTNGHAVLFIVKADTGELLRRIDTQAGSCNGLSTPIAVDVDYDDKVDYVYAGDLKGNLWKFDLTADDYTQWGVAYSDGGVPKPLFQTGGQPITSRPNVMYHCDKHGYLVAFGTGKYLYEDDLNDTSTQTLYGVWDYGDDADDSEWVGTFSSGMLINTNLPMMTSLLQQSVIDERTENGKDLRTFSDGDPAYLTTTLFGGTCGVNSGTESCDPNDTGQHPDPTLHAGWYFNLPNAGERVISDVVIRDGVLTVISYMPSSSPCGVGGSSWVMALDACSGTRLPGAFFDVNGDGVINDQDQVNIGSAEDPVLVPPSGIKYDGKLQPPAYLIMPDGTEKLYMSSSRVKIETLIESAPRLGMTYWRVYRR